MARSKDIAIVAHSVAMVVVLSFVMLPSGTGQVVSQSLTVLNAGTDSDDADNAGQRRSVDPPNLPFSSKVNMLVGTGKTTTRTERERVFLFNSLLLLLSLS
eukprot:scpid99843/ scgid2435/ 